MANEIVKYEQVKDRIVVLRGEPVLLDADVAQLYGVETKRVNEAVKNNPDKFPEGFLFSLNEEEKKEVVENFDHLQKLKFSPVNPTAFTERGLYMLATILKSPRATQTTLAIIDLAVLAEHESMLNKAAKYIRRLAKQVTDDPTCMSKEEYFAMLDRAEQGPSHAMLPGEDLTAFLKRRGYDV